MTSRWVRTAVPGPRLRVGSCDWARTSPSSVTRPAAPSEPSEVGEADVVTRDRLFHLGAGEPGHLRLPLLAIAAVGEVLVEVAGMGHELRHAGGQGGEVGERALARPVG